MAASIVVFILVRVFILQVFWIPTGSMVPTLVPGDRVLVDKAAYWLHGPREGDVVVFSDPTPTPASPQPAAGRLLRWVEAGLGIATPRQQDFVKRVVALPGQTWEIRDGTVYVNGRAVDEPYVRASDDRSFGPGTVPPGTLFVLGDDRPRASDSRFPEIGYVPLDHVVGRVVARVWPVWRAGWL